MKPPATETKLIEKYLAGKLSAGETLLFKARLLLDPVLHLNVRLQQKTNELVKLFGRRKLKARLEETHRKLFQNPNKQAFRQEIQNIFTK